jgi:fatty acid desaturase
MHAVLTQPRASTEYADLKRQVQALGLLRRQPGYYAAKFVAIVALLAIAGAGLVLAGSNPWLRLLDAAFLAFTFGQIGLLAHDLSHQQIVGAGRANTVLGLILGNFLLGVSRAWWRDNHDAHHAHPNNLGEDPNLNILLLGCTPEQALSRPSWIQWIIRHQVALLVPIFCLEFFSMHQQSIDYVLRGRPGLARGEGLALAAHFIVYGAALYLTLGVLGALAFFLVHSALTGLYLASIFAPNHKGMPLAEDGPQNFLRQQTETARNVRGGPLVDLVYGGLNYQIEHHLFPTMPRNNLSRVQPVVRAFCEAHGVAYSEASVVASWREVVGHFTRVSRAMKSTTSQPNLRNDPAGSVTS